MVNGVLKQQQLRGSKHPNRNTLSNLSSIDIMYWDVQDTFFLSAFEVKLKDPVNQLHLDVPKIALTISVVHVCSKKFGN